MRKQALKTLYHCVYNLNYHLVLVTKYRRKCITRPILQRLEAILEGLCQKWDCELMEFNGASDHVHLLVALNPKVQPSIFANNLKTVSSRLLRKEFAQQLAKVYSNPVFWSRSYCILTCGGAPLSVIKQYIEQQQGVD